MIRLTIISIVVLVVLYKVVVNLWTKRKTNNIAEDLNSGYMKAHELVAEQDWVITNIQTEDGNTECLEILQGLTHINFPDIKFTVKYSKFTRQNDLLIVAFGVKADFLPIASLPQYKGVTPIDKVKTYVFAIVYNDDRHVFEIRSEMYTNLEDKLSKQGFANHLRMILEKQPPAFVE